MPLFSAILKGRKHLFRNRYTTRYRFTASVQWIHKTTLQLVNQFKNCSQICHIFGPQRFIPTDLQLLETSSFWEGKNDKLSKKSHKICVDQRPAVTPRLLSPTALKFFKEILRGKSHQCSHYLQCLSGGDQVMAIITKEWGFWGLPLKAFSGLKN